MVKVDSDWHIKEHLDFIHLEFFDPLEVDQLRRVLIDDMRKLAKDEWYDIPCFHLLNDMEDIINKRFGHEKSG